MNSLKINNLNKIGNNLNNNRNKTKQLALLSIKNSSSQKLNKNNISKSKPRQLKNNKNNNAIKNQSNKNNIDNEEKTKIIYVKQTLQQAISRVRKEQQDKKKQLLQNHSQVSKFIKTSRNTHRDLKQLDQNQFNTDKKQEEEGTFNNSIHFQKKEQEKHPDQHQDNENHNKVKGQSQKQKHEQNPQEKNKQSKIENKQLLQINPILHDEILSNKNSNKTELYKNKITTKSCRSFATSTSYQKISKTMAQRLQEKQREAKQKIMKIKINLLENQTKFKLQKKIKQNMQLVQKKQLLSQFFLNKLEWQKQRDQNLRKKRQEQRLLHESNQMKIQMLKKLKKRTKKNQLQLCRSKSQESLLNMQFSKTLKQKQKQQKKQLLVQRYRFLKNKNKSLINFKTERHGENRLNSVQTNRKTFANERNITARQKY